MTTLQGLQHSEERVLDMAVRHEETGFSVRGGYEGHNLIASHRSTRRHRMKLPFPLHSQQTAKQGGPTVLHFSRTLT